MLPRDGRSRGHQRRPVTSPRQRCRPADTPAARASVRATSARRRNPPFLQVIVAYLLGSVFFHDPITALGLAGTALIACGVVVVNLEKLLAAARRGGSGEAGGLQPATEQQPQEFLAQGAWWHRLLPRSGAELPPIKAKQSDLEAELGRLPGPAAGQHRYQSVRG